MRLWLEAILMPMNDVGSSLTGKNILVTGAAGFIGSNLVPELLRRGNRVACLVRPGENTSRIQGLNCRIVYGDLSIKSTLVDAVTGVEYIFHLAAVMGGVSPEALLRVNSTGTRNLVEVCREQSVELERFLFVSSATVMGPSGEKDLLDENAPCRPVSAYGRSKLEAEEFLASLNCSFPFTIIRLPVVYGPGSDGGLYVFFKMLSKGVQLNFGPLEATVCFVWDVVQGVIAAAETPRTRGETYILGEEKAYPIEQVYQTIAALLGKRPLRLPLPYIALHVISFFIEMFSKWRKSIPFVTREELAQYVQYRYWRYDTTKASRDFGFQIRYPFEKGAQITVDWYRQNGYI